MAGSNPIILPSAGAEAITREVMGYGYRDVETGGFLLALESAPLRITAIAMAGDRGVKRSWGLFRISGEAIDQLFGWSDEYGLRIPVQFHSHQRGPELSPIDKQEGFNVLGFISCVVPTYQDPPVDLTEWGWWAFDGATWLSTPAAVLDTGDVETVVFDEDGVRPYA